MISLKRYIDSGSAESLRALCESYRASLTVMGTSATQICPHLGEDFQHGLLNLRDQLSAHTEPEAVTEIGKQAEAEIKKWGECTSEYFHQTAHDVKEIMMVVAETTQSLGERDQRYAREFEEFAGHLAAIVNLEDLTKVRQSLGESALQLKACVENMVKEGEESVSRIRAELSVYQTRLDEAERVATQDPVTGVATRYKAERQLQLRIERSLHLSILLFDLDNFKQTNDLYGHPAGDTLLKQFATELRTFFRSTDLVSRWGGDEFLVILDGCGEEVPERVEPVRKWVCGDYLIQVGGQARKVSVSASIGFASWRAGESAADLIARADAAMYREKADREKARK